MGWLLPIAACGLLYPYVIYPLLIGALTRFFGRKRIKPGDLPTVAILVSAFNEEGRIGHKIDNFEALDYPAELIEMWIGTDGSGDKTANIIRIMNHSRVHLIERQERNGKTAVLNELAGRTRARILVFTDVNAMFRPDAVRRLAAHFNDPAAGLVSGRTRIRTGAGNVAVEGAYYRLESMLKRYEGACGWLAGADGAIYAMRASLYRDLPRNMINDLVHPCQVVADGYGARFEPLAVSEESAGDDAGREFDRQTRIAAQASYLLACTWWPLVRSGRWGMLWVLLSHKWLRWIAGIWIPLGFIGLASISIYWASLGLAIALLLFVGWRLRAAWASIPVFFLIVHSAYLRGLWHALKGERYVVWQPRAG